MNEKGLALVCAIALAATVGCGDEDDAGPPSIASVFCEGGGMEPCAVLVRPVPDFTDVQCIDENDEDVCPGFGQPRYGQDGSYSINPEALTTVVLAGPETRVDEAVSGLSWTPDLNAAANLDAARALCDARATASYAERDDWRVPDLRELFLLASRTGSSGSTWPAGFADPGNSVWWSETEKPANTDNAAVVSGNWPWALELPKDGISASFENSRYVFCVSGDPAEGGYSVSGDLATVTHTTTGLEWERGKSDAAGDWDAALTRCEGLDIGGDQDWRVPTLREYMSVFDPNPGQPVLPAAFEDVDGSTMLTGTPPLAFPSSPNVSKLTESSLVVGQENLSTASGKVRCVRGPGA